MTATVTHRTITEAEYQALPIGLNAGRTIRPGLDDFLTLAERLTAAGYATSDALAHLRQLRDAAWDAATEEMPQIFTDLQPDDLTKDDVKAMIRHAALTGVLRTSVAGHDTMLGGALDQFTEALRPHAERWFDKLGDEAVTAMRPEFDQAVKAVRKAHTAGVTSHTTTTQIATTADAKQVSAWRALPEAVATLDRLADLRIRIHNLTRWHDPNPDAAIATLVEGALTDGGQIEGAANTYRGPLETVLVSGHPGAGPAAKRIAKPRTGGAWLSLIEAGYNLRLSLPSEVTG